MVENLQQSVLPTEASEGYSLNSSTSEQNLDPKVFSSILISLKMQQEEMPMPSDGHTRLLELMHSPPVRAILGASENLAKLEGISPQDALQQIILSFKEIDRLWNHVLMKEGLARLSSQYH